MPVDLICPACRAKIGQRDGNILSVSEAVEIIFKGVENWVPVLVPANINFKRTHKVRHVGCGGLVVFRVGHNGRK